MTRQLIKQNLRAIVSSDDGELAAGFHQLKGTIRALSLDVISAPSVSVISNLGTALRDCGGSVSCAGAVASALTRDRPDVVAVGINHGPNVGPSAIHSGSVGGALVAVMHSIPAAVFSLDDVHSTFGREDGRLFWRGARKAASVVMHGLYAQGSTPRWLLVNIPNLPLGRIRGIAFVSLGSEPSNLSQGYVTVVDLAEMISNAVSTVSVEDKQLVEQAWNVTASEVGR